MRFITPNLNQKGFTMIEAMISLCVISIGLLAITRMQISSINGNTTAMNTLRATIESSANSELFMSQNFNNLLGGTTVPVTSSDGRYQTNYTVTNVTLYSGIVYQSINVTTTWSEAGHSKNLQTTITKLP